MTVSTVNPHAVLAAWNAAVAAFHDCWAARRLEGCPVDIVAHCEERMHSTGVEFARLSGWQAHGPCYVACGGNG